MKNRRLAVYFGLILFLIAAYFLRLSLTEKPEVIPKNQQVTLVVTVSSEPRISERFQVIEIGDSRLFTDLFPRYNVGDVLRVEGYVREDGLIFNAQVLEIGQKASWRATLANLRAKLASNITSLLPSREATLVSGAVLGVDEIAAQFRDALIKTGTIHVVVVSGQNLMIVAGLFLAQARYIGRRKSLVLATLAVFSYALLTGFEPPVVRASLMVLAGSLAIFLGREVFPVLNLLLAALIIVFIWPRAIFEVSFQLTFAATFNSQFSIFNLFGQNAAIAISAYLFTAPVILYHFSRVSILSPITNVLVAVSVAPIMILGFLIAAASLVFMPLAQILAYFAYVPAFYFVKVVEMFSKIPLNF